MLQTSEPKKPGSSYSWQEGGIAGMKRDDQLPCGVAA